jgi:hypothetical protein
VKPFNPRDDGDKKELVTGESAKETVKTTVQGKPDASGDLWLLTRVLFDAHAAAGPSDTRLSLRPLLSEARKFMQHSGDQRRENAESYLKLERRHCEERSDANRHCERSEAIHFAAQRKNGLLRRFAPRNDGVRIGCFEN